MTRGQKSECRHGNCHEPVHIWGLCVNHHQEKIAAERARQEAEVLLERQLIDGKVIQSQGLIEEAETLRRYWRAACYACQCQRDVDIIPLEEANFAFHWCINLAELIVKAEREAREGKSDDFENKSLRSVYWERFDNLKKGLRSNGTPKNA